MVTLSRLDTLKKEDQEFLYEVLKFRFSNPIVNIKYKHSEELPSFEEHVKYINSGKIKKFYKIILQDYLIGMIYIDINNVSGTFILPDLLKKAVRNVKTSEIKKTLSAKIHIALFKDNPEVEFHYANVNPDNKLSMNALLENGYEIVEHVLVFRLKNGIAQHGKWKGCNFNKL